MKRNFIRLFSIFMLLSAAGCLQDRDNPNDPRADNNYVDGAPEIRVRQGDTVILDGDEYWIEDTTLNSYTDTTFIIGNAGDAYLDITGMQMTSSPVYSVISNPTTPVKPGSSTSFTVRFSPVTSPGVNTILIYIEYPDENNESTVFAFIIRGTAL